MRLRALAGITLVPPLLLAAGAEAAHLEQTHKAKLAPSPLTTSLKEGYPLFSPDGKLLLFTRVKKEAGKNNWKVAATYIKNYSTLAGTPIGQDLPGLSLSPPMYLPLPNDQQGEDPNHGDTFVNEKYKTQKAIAYCDDGAQPVGNSYSFTLFFSRGVTGGTKQLWRSNITVTVSGGNVTNTSNGAVTQLGASVNVSPTLNSTEPWMSRDGRYLIWASQVFNQIGSHFIKSAGRCTHTGNETRKPYASLPPFKYRWRDQFSGQILRTNYHALVERPNGRTALLFEECSGGAFCGGSENGVANNNQISTTGFDSGSSPQNIVNCAGCSGSERLNLAGRATHPSIAGPRRPDGTWLLFFFRAGNIWYTKIKEP